MRTVYLNGTYIPETQAQVSIFDRGFQFSDAVYEVVSVMDGKLVDFGGHMTRLTRSLSELGIQGASDSDTWLEICRQLVARNGLKEGMIYWQVTRGAAADRSFYFPPEGTPPTVVAFTQSLPLIENVAATKGLSVVTLPDLRWGRADIKTTQLLYASMMKMEAKRLGVDDAWMVRDGLVSEGTSQNAHIVTADGVLVTHQLDRNILHGITRAAVLELADGLSLRFEERAFSVAEAQSAREAFVSAASTFVMAVVSIDGVSVGDGNPGPVSQALRKAYIAWARKTAI
jgi:D-alanine transaminase